MRPLTIAALLLIAVGSPAPATDPPEKLSVAISAHKDVAYAAVCAVLSAVEKNGVPAKVSLRVSEAPGMSAQIRVSPDIPYRDLAGLLDALKKAGVGRIGLGGRD